MTNLPRCLAAAVLAASTLPMLPIATASASQYDSFSCSSLWYQRNSFYAEAGYCFKTARARAVFGTACFPPYGQLNGYGQYTVGQIKQAEARKGCPTN